MLFLRVSLCLAFVTTVTEASWWTTYAPPINESDIFIDTQTVYNFSSPNYPGSYTNNLNIRWNFWTHGEYKLLLSFRTLDTEKGFDYVKVGNGDHSSYAFSWSGYQDESEVQILSSGRSLWMTFKTDLSVTESGFAGSVQAVNTTSSDFNCNAFLCSSDGVCIPRSSKCDSERNCGSNVDEDSCGTGFPTTSLPFTSGDSIQAIRLTGGNSSLSGRVEVLYNGQWGTVCDHHWDWRDARVACHQLGYHNAIAVFHSAYFGQGSGQIWMDGLHCNGYESSLFECEHRGFGQHNCTHNDDAGVLCGVCFCDSVCDELNDCCDYCKNGTMTTNQTYVTTSNTPTITSARQEPLIEDIFIDPQNVHYFTSPNYPNNYANHLSIGWIFSTHGEYKLLLRFHDLNTERGYDYVRVGNGDNLNNPYAFSWSGDQRESEVQILSYGRSLWMTFETDYSVTRSGFAGSVQAVNTTSSGLDCDDFLCSSDGVCIPHSSVCDYERNCGSNYDEDICEAIRLTGGNSSSSGRVEVLYNGQWGTVCDHHWDWRDARVVCRQLGYHNAISVYDSAYFGQGSGPIWLDDLRCNGYESSLYQCGHNGFGQHNCTHNDDAGVLCGVCFCDSVCDDYNNCCDYCEIVTTANTPTITPTDTLVPTRLVDGTTNWEGRVEILHNGVWGTVCDDYWDINDARVVCRQLGYSDAEAALSNAYFGQGSGQIWLDDLQCTGSETSLDQCPHIGYGNHNCAHYEDASVRCTDPSEHIILRCGPSSFQVDIPRQLIDEPYYASDFYLSGDPYDYTCRGFYNGNWYVSLNSTLTGCGTRSNDNGIGILYNNVVEIIPSNDNSIVDFLGVEIPITCEYNSSERLHTHFKTISDVIRKTAKGSFKFDFAMYTDIGYAGRYYTYPVETRLNEDLYFRAEILQSASNLEIHLRSCRATPSPDYDDAVVYEFINAGCGINNAPVRVLTPNQPTQADFEITSFRFRSDLGNPESEVWVHCEVVVCDVNDTNSECRHGCEQPRYRRSLESPPLKVQRMVMGPIVLKGEHDGESETAMRTEDNNDSPSIFNEILSGVSLVMLLGLIVMGVALTKVITNSATRGYQPLPNPSGVTTG